MLSTNPTGPLGVRWFGNSFKLKKACTYPLSGPPTKPRWKCRLRASLSLNTMKYAARASNSPMLIGKSFVFSYIFFLANNPSPRTGARCNRFCLVLFVSPNDPQFTITAVASDFVHLGLILRLKPTRKTQTQAGENTFFICLHFATRLLQAQTVCLRNFP